MAHQWQKATSKVATAPFQYTLSTKAGCECGAHVLQGLTQLHPDTTITSIDGISAFDLSSRESMLTAFTGVEGGQAAQHSHSSDYFFGSPSEYWWEDDAGTVHRIPQGEGGEQGGALMPLLFCLGQHRALEAAQRQLRNGERLLALLDDIYLATPPAQVGPAYTAVQQ